MADPSTRPSLRLIAGDLVTNLAHDVAGLAEVALTGRPLDADDPIDIDVADGSARSSVPPRLRIAIVGGGISGLAAAWSLIKDRKVDADITIYEADTVIGGKLRLNDMEGLALDAGAESLLAVRPEALTLTKSVGLGRSIVNPATTSAGVVARGEIHPLPSGLISGIPTDLRALAASDILPVPGLLRIPFDHWLPKTEIDGDTSVGDYVTTRLGREVVDRLVEPMLGGVYAGRAEELSLEMTVPALFRLAKRERSLLIAAKEARQTGAAGSGARRSSRVFAGISGGVGRLPIALSDRLSKLGVQIERGVNVTALRRTRTGWRLMMRDSQGSRKQEVDAVILACPAPVSARLLRKVNPVAASTLDTVNYASVALVTFLYDPSLVPSTVTGSGFLVPPVEGYAVKAVTYSSRKWSWVARSAGGRGRATDGSFFVARASLGRFGEPELLAHDDEELTRIAASNLTQLAGLPARPLAARVNRWNDSLPQYTVGHRGRMARVREELVNSPGLAVCGAAYDGVGIAACIGSAQFAAGQLSEFLAERKKWAHV